VTLACTHAEMRTEVSLSETLHGTLADDFDELGAGVRCLPSCVFVVPAKAGT
jgi:hypothetical protein